MSQERFSFGVKSQKSIRSILVKDLKNKSNEEKLRKLRKELEAVQPQEKEVWENLLILLYLPEGRLYSEGTVSLFSQISDRTRRKDLKCHGDL